MSDLPPGMLDMWTRLRIDQLTTDHFIAVMGAELKVVHCEPADRGGDFYLVEAMKFDGARVVNAVSLQTDRNREIYARLDR